MLSPAGLLSVDPSAVALVPHAPAWMREYSEVVVLGATVKKRIRWHLPGTYWLWSTKPEVIKVPDTITKVIPLTFVPQSTSRFLSVDVVISAAPPEFTNARRYLLRFHLTIVHKGKPPVEPKKETSSNEDEDRLAHLERVVQTERLFLLSKQCEELKKTSSNKDIHNVIRQLQLLKYVPN